MKKNTKIIIISPIHPYRGGIAQYAEALSEGFDNNTDVSIVSFKRLYPSILYPGKTDKVANIKESPHPKANYILDFISPFSWLRTVRKVKSEKPDIVIIAWWTFFWQPILALIAWRLRQDNNKVAFLCHNVIDHDASWIKSIVSKACLRASENFITHTKTEHNKIQNIVKNSKILLQPHPIYTHFPKPNKRLKRKGEIELLFFGLIRPYKGVDLLIEAVSSIKNRDIHLTIVGEVWGKDSKANIIEKINNSNANIEYNLTFVNDIDAANYFARSDVVILPYFNATGSGVVTLAYNYNKPVIATDIPGLNEVVSSKTGWLVKPGSVEELQKCISSLNEEMINERLPAIKSYCRKNSWKNMSKNILKFSNDID